MDYNHADSVLKVIQMNTSKTLSTLMPKEDTYLPVIQRQLSQRTLGIESSKNTIALIMIFNLKQKRKVQDFINKYK